MLGFTLGVSCASVFSTASDNSFAIVEVFIDGGIVGSLYVRRFDNFTGVWMK
jgi:hypothetical protein